MVERFYRGILDANATIDELHNALGTSGYTGSINDRIAAYGAAGGYTGSINDKAARYANNPALAAIRLAMSTATEYAVAGDSTRDNAYNEGIAYYTRMLGKDGITVIDNAASGQSGLDWVNETDTPNKATLIAAITGTGSGTVVEFSYGINDVDSSGDAIAGHGGTAASDIVATFKTGIDAVLTSKPDTTFVFVEPVTVASAARNTTLREIYTLLSAEYPQFYLVRMQDHMDLVYDNNAGNIFYFDGTHPDNIGTIRVINKILNEILDDSQLSTVQLDNEHWSGSAENVITSLTSTDIRTGGFWSTSAATFSSNVNWACWPILEVTNGQIVRVFHNGNRDEIVYSNSGTGADNTGAVFLSTDTVPDTGALPNEYEHNVVDASATRAGLNIHSDGRALVGDEYLQVIEIIPGQAAGDLTQQDINVGLTGQRLVDPDTVGTSSFGDPDTYTMPFGVPTPTIWYSPRNVTLNGSNEITLIANNGSGGSTYDQAARTANLATIDTAKSGWNDKDVFNIPSTTTGGYEATGDLTTAKTVMTIATYKTGVETTFGDFDGLFDKDPANAGAELGFVGNSGTGATFTGLPSNVILNGTAIGDAATVLPMNKDAVGAVRATNASFNVLWHDEFSTGRNWVGFMGDMLVWNVELTAGQIKAVDLMLHRYYGY